MFDYAVKCKASPPKDKFNILEEGKIESGLFTCADGYFAFSAHGTEKMNHIRLECTEQEGDNDAWEPYDKNDACLPSQVNNKTFVLNFFLIF